MTASVGHRLRLAYLVSHPIQYQAPLLRRIALEAGIDLTVLFGSDFSARGYRDEGFGIQVAWDTPLLEGYKHRVLPAWRDDGTVSALTPISRNLLGALRNRDGSAAFDALWVHGYASVNALHGMVLARALGIPVLLRAESWLADRPRGASRLLAKKLFLRALRPFVSAVLPIGSHNAEYWRAYLGDSVPQFPMPYAVDNQFFAEKAAAAQSLLPALRTELQMEAGRPVILFASKLQERKHADHLLHALRELTSRGRCQGEPYLVMVGDGEERPRLEAMARDAGLDHVRFAGFRNQTELPAFFALCDVFVLPSRHEPWGLITNEVMATGKPVILSSDVGAARDLVTDEVEGYVYPFGDIGALTLALEAVLATPDRARQMGEAAARRMADWDLGADVRGLRSVFFLLILRTR